MGASPDSIRVVLNRIGRPGDCSFGPVRVISRHAVRTALPDPLPRFTRIAVVLPLGRLER